MGIVVLKMYAGHPIYRWVSFFIRFGEMLHYITCSAVDALQWMGAVRMRVQTADKNITIIHTTPEHQLTSWDLVGNKSIIKIFLHSNFRQTYDSMIHNYLDLFLTNMQLFTPQDINWWTGEVWITVMFLSAVWTLILTAPIHCRASIGEQVM